MPDKRISEVISLAQQEIGYIEKKSASGLDSKSANIGSGNYTKYARDLDAIPGFLNGKKQGYAWCAVWFNWLFVKTFGIDDARRMLFLPMQSGSASCTTAVNYYKGAGAFYSNPRAGDQVFFTNSKGQVAHTGIVEKVTKDTLYTIEGNTSTDEGVVENGGGVCRKSYPIKYNRIYGYGRPDYVFEQDIDDCKNVAEVQVWLNRDFGQQLEVDGEFGPLTHKALVKAAQMIIGVDADGDFGINSKNAWPLIRRGKEGAAVKVAQAMLLCLGYKCIANGEFDAKTALATKEYQKKNKLITTGMIGQAMAGKLFKR